MTADGRIVVEFVLTDLRVGGAERVFQTVLTSLDPKTFELRVSTLYGEGEIADELRAAGIPVVTFGAAGALDMVAFLRFARYLRVTAPDIVFLNSTPATQAWVAGASLGSHFRTISALHYTQRERRSRRTRFINRLTEARVERFVALSETHKRYIVAHEGMAASSIQVIPNGVDVGRYSLAVAARDISRSRFGFEPEHVVVGILARLRPEKQHDFLLEAAARIIPHHPEARFLLMGDGPEEARLQQLTTDLGIEDHVVFGGHQPDVASVICAADVGVLCSRFEAFPLSLLEFMAAGLPVVSTNVGSVAEIVVDGETGVVVPEGDLSAFVTALVNLMDDSRLRARYGAASAKRAAELYPVSRMVDLTAELIREVAKG